MQYRLIAIRNIVKYLAGFLLIYVSSIWIARTAEESVRSYVFAQAETRVKEGIHTVEESVEKMNLIQQMVCQNPDFTSLIYSGDDSAGEKVLKVKDSSSLLVRTGYMTEFTPYIHLNISRKGRQMREAEITENETGGNNDDRRTAESPSGGYEPRGEDWSDGAADCKFYWK